jgi:mercuric ion binding protein
MKRVAVISFATVCLAVTGISSLGALLPSSALAGSAQAGTTAQQAVFNIENMTCALCRVTVKKAMEGVVGVKAVAIDFDAKTALVTFDPSKATIAAIAQASTNAGYPAHATKS